MSFEQRGSTKNIWSNGLMKGQGRQRRLLILVLVAFYVGHKLHICCLYLFVGQVLHSGFSHVYRYFKVGFGEAFWEKQEHTKIKGDWILHFRL